MIREMKEEMQTCRKELCCHARRALSFRVVVGGGWGGGGLEEKGVHPETLYFLTKKLHF